MDRRQFLGATGTVVALGALAGCSLIGTDTETEPPSPVPTDAPTESPTRSPTAGPTESPTVTQAATGTESPTPTPTATPTATPRPDADRPVIFNEPAKIAALREKVSAGESPWRGAFEEFREAADGALDADPRSVVDNGAPAGVDDPHKYGSDAPYQGKDGVFSDDINREDYMAALDMKDWIRDTAVVYAFTGEDRYAEKAIDLLTHWFVDPETRMYPSTRNYGPHTEGLKGQNAIEHYIFLPAMLYGAALVSGHPHWDEASDAGEAGIAEWLGEARDTLESDPHGGTEGDEIYKWWVTTRILVAASLGDMDGMERACEDWRTTALTDFAERGTFELERPRTRGLYYSLSAMNALTFGAEIADKYGIDLYEYTMDGMSLSVIRKSHRYHAEPLIDPSEWQWQERNGLDKAERNYGAASYELCYSRWDRDEYLNAAKTAGRPVYDRRILGFVTLTHGSLHKLDY